VWPPWEEPSGYDLCDGVAKSPSHSKSLKKPNEKHACANARSGHLRFCSSASITWEPTASRRRPARLISPDCDSYFGRLNVPLTGSRFATGKPGPVGSRHGFAESRHLFRPKGRRDCHTSRHKPPHSPRRARNARWNRCGSSTACARCGRSARKSPFYSPEVKTRHRQFRRPCRGISGDDDFRSWGRKSRPD
jgi:hypothetical protein